MYGDSQALSSDSNSIFPLSLKAKEGLTTKSRELFMDSDTSYSNEYIQYQNNQTNPGLLRFRSAPGSFFAILTDGVEKSGANSSEAQGLASRFSSGGAKCNIVSQSAQVLQDDKAVNGYALNSQLPPQYPRQSAATQVGSMDGGYRVVGSIGMDHQGQAKMGSSLMRQNSSPAGLFSHLTSQNDYAAMRGVESYRVANGGSGDLSLSSSRLKGQMNYSSGLSSSLGMLSRISEVESENGGAITADDEKPSNENREAQFYSSGFPFGSWNDSSNFTENLSGLKREVDGDVKSFASSQSAELRNQPPILSHHLSLPTSSAEMAAMEKLLHFQDVAPCKIRAKRGFATHPRSIAERVRRTRISERMRKLQDLVPNMDKQTNTADMLDFAVEYIKDLRKQYKTLADIRSNCKCSAVQKPVPNQTS